MSGASNTPDLLPATEHDLVIIGGGPAGATAALYAARADLATVVIDKGVTAGALGATGIIANYPGLPDIGGAELVARIRAQAEAFGAVFVPDKVQGVELQSTPKVIYGNSGTYHGKTVLIATGSMGRTRRVPGEERLLGRGVSYCATCDGAFYRGRDVAVAGSSDEAAEEALFLARFAREVHLLVPTPALNVPPPLAEALAAQSRLRLHLSTVVREVLGADHVAAVRVAPRGEPEHNLPVSGVFFYLQGGQPVTDFLAAQVPTHGQGCLAVDAEFRTAIPGVYAAGDVLCQHVKQAVVSAAEGAVAAMAVEKQLRGLRQLSQHWRK